MRGAIGPSAGGEAGSLLRLTWPFRGPTCHLEKVPGGGGGARGQKGSEDGPLPGGHKDTLCPQHTLPFLQALPQRGKRQLAAPQLRRVSCSERTQRGLEQREWAGRPILTRGLARAGLAQGGGGRQLLTGGSFGGEVRGGRGRGALSVAAQLGQGRGHALVVPCGAEEVIEDLQDGADVAPRPPATVLAVGVQRACRGRGAPVSAQGPEPGAGGRRRTRGLPQGRKVCAEPPRGPTPGV